MWSEYKRQAGESFSGGFVIFVLVFSEYVAHEWLQAKPPWFLWVILVFAFLVGSAVHGWIAVWFRRRELREERRRAEAERQQEEERLAKPILVGNLGEMDGRWMDAIWFGTDSQPTEGSIITVSSTRRDGFSVHGETFDKAVKVRVGQFESDSAYLMKDGKGVYYEYKGEEEGKEDHGVGYYRFTGSASKREFHGRFLAIALKKPVRRVEGIYLGKAGTVSDGDAQTRLRKFLEDRGTGANG